MRTPLRTQLLAVGFEPEPTITSYLASHRVQTDAVLSTLSDAYGHYYGGGYAGSRNFSDWYTATDNVDCAANWGQNVAISNGSAACDIYGLNGGVGYVLLSRDWYFTGSPTSNGRLNQQYDCDDI